MAEIQWIKLSTDFFGDDKIKQIRAMPEGDAMLLIWLNLLVMAGKTNDGGLIYLTEGLPYNDEMLSVALNRSAGLVRHAIGIFKMLHMVEETPDGLLISNWEKHQNIDGMERAREKTRNRVRNYRERKMAQALLETGDNSADVTHCNVTDRYNVTPCNADVTVQNKNKSKNKKEEYILYAPPLYDTNNVGSKRNERAGENEDYFEGVNDGERYLDGACGTGEAESCGTSGNRVDGSRLRKTEKGPLDWHDLSKDRLH